MKSLIKWLGLMPLMLGAVLLGAGCQESAVEEAAEGVDNAAATTTDSLDEAAGNAAEAARDAGNALDADGPVENAVEDATTPANP